MSEDFNLVNLTSHEIVVKGRRSKHTIKPSGMVARVKQAKLSVSTGVLEGVKIDIVKFLPEGVAVYSDKKGEKVLDGLPPVKEGTWYIVPSVVKMNARDREDLICPDTGQTSCKDTVGNVVYVTRFIA